jgi:hypothetical protein
MGEQFSRFCGDDRKDTCERPINGRLTCTFLRKVHKRHDQQQVTIAIHRGRKADERV